MDYFERKLDDKNRLTIPAEVRDEFNGEVVMTQGFDNTIFLYPQDRWNTAVEPALKGDIISQENFALNRQLRRGKTSSTLDAKQGRITVEQHLLDYASISKSLVATRISSSTGFYWALEAKV